jgi:hypothetical protein
MKKTISLVFLLLLCQIVSGQRTLVHIHINYCGSIDKYPIAMELVRISDSNSISGSYYYLKSGVNNDIYLDGILHDSTMKLEESIYNQKTEGWDTTGMFKLTFDAQANMNGSWTNRKGKTLPATLIRTEKVCPVEYYSFELNLFKADCEGNVNNDKSCYKATQLKIFDEKKTLVQTISGFDEAISNKPIGRVELIDMNFDGFLDLRIPIWFPDAIRNDGSYLYFLFDTKSGRFIKNNQLDELGFLFFISKSQELYDISADGSGDDTQTYYKWSADTLLVVRVEKTHMDNPYVYITEYKIQGNKSVKVKSYKKKAN